MEMIRRYFINKLGEEKREIEKDEKIVQENIKSAKEKRNEFKILKT